MDVKAWSLGSPPLRSSHVDGGVLKVAREWLLHPQPIPGRKRWRSGPRLIERGNWWHILDLLPLL